MRTLLVSLVSDQTVPNVQLIKEFKSRVTDYLFISTETMEKKGCRRWIEKTTQIESLEPLIVGEYSYDDIQQKLGLFDFSVYEKIIVNLTGGTKVMTLAAHDFFREEGADIFYVTGSDKKYIKIFPGKKKQVDVLVENLTVKEYLNAYGFDLELNTNKEFESIYTNRMFQLFCTGEIEKHVDEINYLRKFRSKGLKEKDWNERISSFITLIGLIPENENKLNYNEVKFLTGEWFEQFIFNKIKEELNLDDTMIMSGVKLLKEVKDNESNIVKSLLQAETINNIKPDNEIDVMFMSGGRFYVIECKTSIIDIQESEIERNGKIEKQRKEINILGETIYKSDSIKTKFGLFANSYIFTVTDFHSYISTGTLSEQNNKTQKMQDLINRGTLSKIKIVDRSKLLNSKTITELL